MGGLQVILDDYVASGKALTLSRLKNELRLKEFLTTDRVIAANRETLDDTISFVCEKYGGAAAYLMKVCA